MFQALALPSVQKSWLVAGFGATIAAGAAVGLFGPLALAGVIAVLAFGVACALIARDPFVGVLLVTFFLPFERIGSVEIGGFTLRISQVFTLVTAIAFLIHLFRRRLRFRPFPILIPLLILFAAALLSFTNAINLHRAATVFAFTAFTALLAFLTSQLVRTPGQFRRVLLALVLTATVVSAFGLFQFVGDLAGLPASMTGIRDLYSNAVFGFPRVHSTELEPLYFANFLFLPLSFALVFLFSSKSPLPKWLLAPLLILFLANFVLTLSRGAYAAGSVMLLFIFALSFRRIFSPVRIVTFALILAGVYVAFTLAFNRTADPQYYVDRFVTQTLSIFSGASYADRAETAAAAWQGFRDHPLIGVGVGNFGPSVTSQPLNVPERGWLIVNNEYLEVLSETGLIGFAGLLAMIVVLLVRSIRAFRFANDPTLRAYVVAASAAVVAILAQYATFSILYVMQVWFAFGLLIAAQNLILAPNPSES